MVTSAKSLERVVKRIAELQVLKEDKFLKELKTNHEYTACRKYLSRLPENIDRTIDNIFQTEKYVRSKYDFFDFGIAASNAHLTIPKNIYEYYSFYDEYDEYLYYEGYEPKSLLDKIRDREFGYMDGLPFILRRKKFNINQFLYGYFPLVNT